MAKRFHIYLSLLFTFLLGIHEGNVALWIEPAREPAVVFPYRAQLLPEQDRNALEQGIRVEKSLLLQQLIEDYLS